jgi:APA family basic amino acid/polyamine antiporter
VVLYLLANISYLALLSLPEIQHAPQDRVAVAAMKAAFGNPGAMCMAAAIMISTFGCNNGLILSGARVYFAMARDRLFFQKIGTTNRNHVPAAALVAQAIWTAFLTLPRTVTIDAATHTATYGSVYTQLLEYIISADLLFYLLIMTALIVLRRKEPAAHRPYRSWGYPVAPLMSILLAGLLIVDIAFLAPATAGMGILIMLTGVPIYFLWRMRGES